MSKKTRSIVGRVNSLLPPDRSRLDFEVVSFLHSLGSPASMSIYLLEAPFALRPSVSAGLPFSKKEQSVQILFRVLTEASSMIRPSLWGWGVVTS